MDGSLKCSVVMPLPYSVNDLRLTGVCISVGLLQFPTVNILLALIFIV